MKRTLTTGEWRLFLLSDCLKYYRDIEEYTRALRKEGKDAVLALDGNDTIHLDNFIDDTDAQAIRGMIMKEWRFSGKVVDNGKGLKTTCEYCQKQQIRYKYLCRNDKTDTWLALGSVCVGYVIHGEDKMKDKEFANKFVEDLDKLKSNPISDDPTQTNYEDLRKEQFNTVKACVQYLRANGQEDNEFLKSLQQWWNSGKALTDKQLNALKSMCTKIKKEKSSRGILVFNSLDAEIHYNKIMLKLLEDPDNKFLQNCKLRIERTGELTPNMIKALMGNKKQA